MATRTQDLRTFLIEEMRDLYDAEKQLIKSLPRIAKAASTEELKEAITEHVEVTKGQVQRLEQCFEHLGTKARSKPSLGIRGILEEGKELLEEDMEEAVKNVAIAAGGRKIAHFEMVAYENLQAIAEQLEIEEVAELLAETLEEEREADRWLSQVSRSIIEEAAAGFEETETEERAGGRRAPVRKVQAARGRKTVSAKSSRGKARGAAAPAGRSEQQGRVLIDHDEIREWAEDRDAEPSCVRGTVQRDGSCVLRLDFPGFTGEESLDHISWDQWFRVFDQKKLALVVQETTSTGEISNFNKLVSRSTVEAKERPKTRGAH